MVVGREPESGASPAAGTMKESTTRTVVDSTGATVVDTDVEAVMAASQVLVGVAARSLAELNELTVPQLRALMILANHGPMSLTELAGDMGVHPSNATRACDGLVAAKLLNRRDNPADRRHLLLEVTRSGRAVIDGVISRRRAAIAAILQQMPIEHRRSLADSLTHFSAAGGEPRPQDLWDMGWIR